MPGYIFERATCIMSGKTAKNVRKSGKEFEKARVTSVKFVSTINGSSS